MVRVATPQNEAKLLDMALHSTGSQLERICRGVRAAQEADNEPVPERFVSSRSMHDGTIQVEARLHADEAALLLQTLAQVRSAMNESRAEGTLKASRADALVRMLQRFAVLGDAELGQTRTGADQAQVFIHVESSQLEEGALAATLEDGSHVSAETLRRVCCDCAMVPIRHDDEDDPLDVGRKTRRIHPMLRRAVLARDKGQCRFPGCSCTRYLDAHHVEHWLHGGETKLGNLISLCPAHHRALHEGGFALTMREGEPHFRDPRGRALPASPEPPRVSAETASRALYLLGSERGIDAQTGLTMWDGEPPQYDACVEAAL